MMVPLRNTIPTTRPRFNNTPELPVNSSGAPYRVNIIPAYRFCNYVSSNRNALAIISLRPLLVYRGTHMQYETPRAAFNLVVTPWKSL